MNFTEIVIGRGNKTLTDRLQRHEEDSHTVSFIYELFQGISESQATRGVYKSSVREAEVWTALMPSQALSGGRGDNAKKKKKKRLSEKQESVKAREIQ